MLSEDGGDLVVLTFDALRERLRAAGLDAKVAEIECSDWTERLAEWAKEEVVVALAERSDGVSPFVFSALMQKGDEERNTSRYPVVT